MSPNRPVFVFDGACPFCSACARFIVGRIPTDARVVAYQLTDIDALGVTAERARESVQWVEPDRRRTSGAEAIADLLLSSRGRLWRLLGGLLARRPVLAVARPTYAWVSRHRHRLPLGPAITDLPLDERERFGDRR